MNVDLAHKGTMLSVLACDPATGTLGIALASSSIAIGSRCPHLETGRAALTSQGFTNLKVGPLALDLIRCGLSSEEVLEALRQHDRWLEYRQIGIIRADGQAAAYTGSMARGWAGHLAAENLLCLGNGLPEQGGALELAAAAWAAHPGLPMDERLLRALESVKAALGAGFPVVSASLLMRSPQEESQIDLRADMPSRPVEDGGNALADLRRLHAEYLPLVEIYAARSVAPQPF
ncbi:DUF1028 domain-containing protein [Poseidonocella sp. HB161398]|uniref:DUF1028 domain-containing protein n=1 Tax=Poseidonocella sp. HB161398 TaxID=2320855 RepID=UPI00110806D2|nr:DUF1028 domain-containing protein [Poseidonocella sp. HB161398]